VLMSTKDTQLPKLINLNYLIFFCIHTSNQNKNNHQQLTVVFQTIIYILSFSCKFKIYLFCGFYSNFIDWIMFLPPHTQLWTDLVSPPACLSWVLWKVVIYTPTMILLWCQEESKWPSMIYEHFMRSLTWHLNSYLICFSSTPQTLKLFVS
jgi:hypothetical protein